MNAVFGWLVFIIFAAFTATAIVAARCNFREWRALKGLPLIRDNGRALEVHVWSKYHSNDYPDPGRPGNWLMDESLCRAYAQLADRRNRALDAVVVAGNVAAAAALGLVLFQLGDISAVISETTIDLDLSDPSALPADFGPGAAFFIDRRMRWLLITTITAAALFSAVSNRAYHGDLRDDYLRAADRQRAEAQRAPADGEACHEHGKVRTTRLSLRSRLCRVPKNVPKKTKTD